MSFVSKVVSQESKGEPDGSPFSFDTKTALNVGMSFIDIIPHRDSVERVTVNVPNQSCDNDTLQQLSEFFGVLSATRRIASGADTALRSRTGLQQEIEVDGVEFVSKPAHYTDNTWVEIYVDGEEMGAFDEEECVELGTWFFRQAAQCRARRAFDQQESGR